MAEKKRDYELETVCEYVPTGGGKGFVIRVKNKK
jgi:hypothetical protein